MHKNNLHYQTVNGKRKQTPTFTSWRNMMARCYRHTDKHFVIYGGRGITVCSRWHNFEHFLSDMGNRPEAMTLDRIKNDGNYEPRNCRWVTWEAQENNRRTNRLITFGDITLTMTQWEKRIGVYPRRTLRDRLRIGWTIKRAFTTSFRGCLPKPV